LYFVKYNIEKFIVKQVFFSAQMKKNSGLPMLTDNILELIDNTVLLQLKRREEFSYG